MDTSLLSLSILELVKIIGGVCTSNDEIQNITKLMLVNRCLRDLIKCNFHVRPVFLDYKHCLLSCKALGALMIKQIHNFQIECAVPEMLTMTMVSIIFKTKIGITYVHVKPDKIEVMPIPANFKHLFLKIDTKSAFKHWINHWTPEIKLEDSYVIIDNLQRRYDSLSIYSFILLCSVLPGQQKKESFVAVQKKINSIVQSLPDKHTSVFIKYKNDIPNVVSKFLVDNNMVCFSLKTS